MDLLAQPLHAQRLPWKLGDPPPTLAGFRLAESPAAAVKRLGVHVTIDTLGRGPDAAMAYTSRERGISLVTSRLDGVAIIYLTSRDAGALDSIRVGDARQRVLTRWGAPSSADKANALWLVGGWVIVAEVGEDDRVVRLGVGRKG